MSDITSWMYAQTALDIIHDKDENKEPKKAVCVICGEPPTKYKGGLFYCDEHYPKEEPKKEASTKRKLIGVTIMFVGFLLLVPIKIFFSDLILAIIWASFAACVAIYGMNYTEPQENTPTLEKEKIE